MHFGKPSHSAHKLWDVHQACHVSVTVRLHLRVTSCWMACLYHHLLRKTATFSADNIRSKELHLEGHQRHVNTRHSSKRQTLCTDGSSQLDLNFMPDITASESLDVLLHLTYCWWLACALLRMSAPPATAHINGLTSIHKFVRPETAHFALSHAAATMQQALL